jgi:hypothetical protein
MQGTVIKKKDIPELAKYAHTEDFSGWQMYAVMTELAKDLGIRQGG